jgi:hypothetical protein
MRARKEIDKVFEGGFTHPSSAARLKLTKAHPLFNQFLDLAGDLSPENLCCDGELRGARLRAKHRDLLRRWAELEAKFGAPVSEDDVWKAYQADLAGM